MALDNMLSTKLNKEYYFSVYHQYTYNENLKSKRSPMDGNNKDKTQSHFYIPGAEEEDLSNTLCKHFSHLRMKLQLQPIIIDNKI